MHERQESTSEMQDGTSKSVNVPPKKRAKRSASELPNGPAKKLAKRSATESLNVSNSDLVFPCFFLFKYFRNL